MQLSQHELKTIDIETLNEVRSLDSSNLGGSEFLKEMIRLFLEVSGEMLSSLKNSIADKELKTMIFNAHRLKGCANNIGASRLGAFCAELEKNGKANEIISISNNHKLDEIYLETVHALNTILNKN